MRRGAADAVPEHPDGYGGLGVVAEQLEEAHRVAAEFPNTDGSPLDMRDLKPGPPRCSPRCASSATPSTTRRAARSWTNSTSTATRVCGSGRALTASRTCAARRCTRNTSSPEGAIAETLAELELQREQGSRRGGARARPDLDNPRRPPRAGGVPPLFEMMHRYSGGGAGGEGARHGVRERTRRRYSSSSSRSSVKARTLYTRSMLNHQSPRYPAAAVAGRGTDVEPVAHVPM